MCGQRTWKLEKDVRPSVTTVTNNYQLPCEYWEGNQDPLEKQPVLFKHSPHECVFNDTKVIMQLQITMIVT